MGQQPGARCVQRIGVLRGAHSNIQELGKGEHTAAVVVEQRLDRRVASGCSLKLPVGLHHMTRALAGKEPTAGAIGCANIDGMHWMYSSSSTHPSARGTSSLCAAPQWL